VVGRPDCPVRSVSGVDWVFLLSSAVLTGVAAEETTRVRGSGLASVPFQRRRVLA
jgi:hypothetical protein